jgi:hypothetical protein
LEISSRSLARFLLRWACLKDGLAEPPRSLEDVEMKIHWLPLPLLLPPAVAQKAAPTAFEIEQRTEELNETAQYWRNQRAKLGKVRRDPRHSDQDADADKNASARKSASRERSGKDTIDVLA